MRGLVGVAPSAVLLLALAGAAATAGEIHYSQFAATVNENDAAASHPAGANHDWNSTAPTDTLVDHPVSGGPRWWRKWFGDDPIDLSHQYWLDNDLVVEPMNAPRERDLTEAIAHWTSRVDPSTPRQPPFVDSARSIVPHQALLQPVDGAFTPSPNKVAWVFGFRPKGSSIDFHRLAPARGAATRVPGTTRRPFVPGVAVVLLLVLGAAILAPLRRRSASKQVAESAPPMTKWPPE